ncbi:uncharacterized protein LOC121812204, partial [Haplochromis burtoni]|uniref:uncharacterized protein LOC121812204 n=1 Tax=Haplochromis burtoni TaxID=8153 RepID=UPI001C2D2377
MTVSPVEVTEPKTVISHQTHLHTATSIVAPQNCVTPPLDSRVSRSEFSHTPVASLALDITVHAEEHKPSETMCSIANAPPSDCFMFQPIFSLDIPDISQPTPQPATAFAAPQRVTKNKTCVAEPANLTSTLSVLPEPGDTETSSHSSAMNSVIFKPALVSVTPSVAPSVSQAVVFPVPQLESANSDATCVNSPSLVPAKVKSRRISSAIHRLANDFGLSTAELFAQVKFSVPHSCQFNSVRPAFRAGYIDSMCTSSRATFCTAVCSVVSHSGCPDAACVSSPVPVAAPGLTHSKTANCDMDNLSTAELLEPAHHESQFADTVFGSNLVHP